jgi:hypothetical protein
MKQTEKVCGTCKGSGVVLRASEYPGFEDHRWCQDCEVGRAKAAWVVQLISASVLKRGIQAA